MKKKLLAVLLMSVLAVSVTACGGRVSNNKDYDVDVKEDFDDVEDEVKESEGTLVFDIPEGLYYDEESMQYLSETQGEVANMNYITNPNDGSFDETTSEMMEAALEQSLSSVYGETIDLTMSEWEYMEVDGYDALTYQVEYLYSGMKVIQVQVIVDGTDNLHFVTFTYLDGEDYADKFADCIDSFRFE